MQGCEEYGRPRFTAKELAELFDVSPNTIRTWRSRGYLTVVGYRRQANLYDYWEAVAVERATRNSPNLRTPRSRAIVRS